jgi:hypothetical protein
MSGARAGSGEKTWRAPSAWLWAGEGIGQEQQPQHTGPPHSARAGLTAASACAGCNCEPASAAAAANDRAATAFADAAPSWALPELLRERQRETCNGVICEGAQSLTGAFATHVLALPEAAKLACRACSRAAGPARASSRAGRRSAAAAGNMVF